MKIRFSKNGFDAIRRVRRQEELAKLGRDRFGNRLPGTPPAVAKKPTKPQRKPAVTSHRAAAATVAELAEFPRKDAERYFRGFYTLAAARHEQRQVAAGLVTPRYAAL